MCWGYSLEVPYQGTSKEYLQHTFLCKDGSTLKQKKGSNFFPFSASDCVGAF